MKKVPFKFTDEQLDIIESNNNLKVESTAGSSKTTTSVYKIENIESISDCNKILYLVFNKSAKEHAKNLLTNLNLKNTDIHTAHSLSYKHIIGYLKYKFKNSYSLDELNDILKVKKTNNRTNYILLKHIANCFSIFCNSKVSSFEEYDYTSDVVDIDPTVFNFIKSNNEKIKSYAADLYNLMKFKKIECNHDFYLKEFQLSSPNLNYTHIIFDEAQDASPVMVDIVMNQKDSIKTFIGDSNQSIYGFRKAINALDNINFETKTLSKSFRYSNKIANIGKDILKWKSLINPNYKVPNISGVGKNKKLDSLCIIGRSNCKLFFNIISMVLESNIYKNFYFEGGIHAQLRTDSNIHIFDVLNLKQGNYSRIRHPILKDMRSFDQLEEFSETTADSELNVLIKIADEYGNRLFSIIKQLNDLMVDNKESADVVFSTVHKAKGLEYDKVILLDDFINKSDIDKLTSPSSVYKINDSDETYKNKILEEINMLYVATTRTKNSLIQNYI